MSLDPVLIARRAYREVCRRIGTSETGAGISPDLARELTDTADTLRSLTDPDGRV